MPRPPRRRPYSFVLYPPFALCPRSQHTLANDVISGVSFFAARTYHGTTAAAAVVSPPAVLHRGCDSALRAAKFSGRPRPRRSDKGWCVRWNIPEPLPVHVSMYRTRSQSFRIFCITERGQTMIRLREIYRRRSG